MGCLQNGGLPPPPTGRARSEMKARNLEKAGTVSWVTLAKVKSQPCGDTWCKPSQEWADWPVSRELHLRLF